jgi:transcription elongation factor Elf1
MAENQSYSLTVICHNCGKRFEVTQEKGKERPRIAECPCCGCYKISYTWKRLRGGA